MVQVQASASGKLYIAGEYAVVDGSSAIIAAVNRYVTVSVDNENLVENGEYCGVIASEGYGYEPLRWTRDLDGNIVDSAAKSYSYVLSAMRVIDTFARENFAPNQNRKFYNLHISSELDDAKTGKKYGLGSSAAVTVAVVCALCKWYGLNLETPIVCKLALIASSMVKKSGSGGDVAASAYGGWVLYCAYDRNWLENEVALIKAGKSNFAKLLRKKWPQLEIKRLNVPQTIKLLVGWTGSPASSAKLVSSVESNAANAQNQPFTYDDFCKKSEICVQKLAKALENSELENIATCFAQNRELLQKLGSLTGTLIETQTLTQLIKDAIFYGIPAKTSGAGGGDCGIAIATSSEEDRIKLVKNAWEAHKIEPLDIKIAKIIGNGEYDENILLGENSLNENLLNENTQAASLTIQYRKDEHIAIADEQYKNRANSGFDAVRFMPNAFPQLKLQEVDSSVRVLAGAGCANSSNSAQSVSSAENTSNTVTIWKSPIYINAMTGGSKSAKEINAQLARVAAKTGVAMASGSLSAALRDESLVNTFSVIRSENPNGFVMANVSAGTSAEDALRAVNMLRANALQVHLNAAQELVMPEGDRDFCDWLKNIESIVKACDSADSRVQIPVIVKETGCGLTACDVLRLCNVGVRTVDVSGSGGTNFVTIENARRERADYDYLADWGLTTVESLLDIRQCDSDAIKNVEVFASGGVRNPLDVVRALALGASAAGVAGEFLHTLVHEGEDALLLQITSWQEQIRTIMALLGCRNVEELPKNARMIISGKTLRW